MNRLFEDFLLFKAENDGVATRTVQAYHDILLRFEAWLDGQDPLSMTGPSLIAFAGPYLHKTLKLAPVSRVPYVACIREFYRWAHHVARVLPSDPGQAIPYPKTGRKLPNVMSLDNAERLMWAPNFDTFEGVRDAAMLAVLVGCGLRIGGLVALNESAIVAQMIDNEPRLALRAREKGKKERLTPIPREADLLLRVYLEHPALAMIDRATTGDQVLFVTTRNRRCPAHEYYGERRRFTTRGAYAMVVRHGRAAGIPADQLNPHALRHLFGTELAEEKVDLIERQMLMGHVDPKSTSIYNHLALRSLTRTVDHANPLAKISTPASQLLGEMTRKPKARLGSS